MDDVAAEDTGELSPRKVPVEFIRRLPRGRGLVVAGNLRPIVVKVRPLQARIAHRLRLMPSAAPAGIAPDTWTIPVELPPVIDLTDRRPEPATEEHGAA